eukprot:7300568-Prymnesium_polylepis.1
MGAPLSVARVPTPAVPDARSTPLHLRCTAAASYPLRFRCVSAAFPLRFRLGFCCIFTASISAASHSACAVNPCAAGPEDGKVSGAKVAPVLRRSGLDNKTLREVWNICDHNSTGAPPAPVSGNPPHPPRPESHPSAPRAPPRPGAPRGVRASASARCDPKRAHDPKRERAPMGWSSCSDASPRCAAGSLDADWFAVAMHLVMKMKKGMPLPATLPPDCVPPKDR